MIRLCSDMYYLVFVVCVDQHQLGARCRGRGHHLCLRIFVPTCHAMCYMSPMAEISCVETSPACGSATLKSDVRTSLAIPETLSGFYTIPFRKSSQYRKIMWNSIRQSRHGEWDEPSRTVQARLKKNQESHSTT